MCNRGRDGRGAVIYTELVEDVHEVGLDGRLGDEQFAREFLVRPALGQQLIRDLGVTGGFSGLDGSGAFASLAAGMSMQTANEWSLDAGLAEPDWCTLAEQQLGADAPAAQAMAAGR